MLRLDKTEYRVVPLHHDQDAEDRARWQLMSSEERQEVLAYLRQQARVLHALRDLGRQQDRNGKAGNVANNEPAT